MFVIKFISGLQIKNMRLFFSILLLVLCISCSSESLEEDSIVKKHFSESEIVFWILF